MARRGKIARLPNALRDAVNQRILDGVPAQATIAWLNEKPEVKAILDEYFAGEPINDENFSQWVKGGYEEWRDDEKRAARLARLSGVAMMLARAAGGSIAAGPIAVAGGRMLEILERAEDGDLPGLIEPLTFLRNTEISTEKLSLDKRRQATKEREVALAEDKFQLGTVEKFLEWARRPETQAILDSDRPRESKMQELRALFFGDPDKPLAGPAPGDFTDRK